MTDMIHKLTSEQSQVHTLAPVIQRWAELCKTQAQQEPSTALSWYLQGRADAHQMDAARLREALSPTILHGPPKEGVVFIHAYEALLQMMRAITQPDINRDKALPVDDPDHAEPVATSRATTPPDAP